MTDDKRTSAEREIETFVDVDTRTFRTKTGERLREVEGTLEQVKSAVGTTKAIVGPLVPISIISALGFVITAYVAFARMEDARAETREHETADIILAHPGASTALTQIREEQVAQRTTLEAFIAEQRRRDDEARQREESLAVELRALRERR